jgi:hypothetical protein
MQAAEVCMAMPECQYSSKTPGKISYILTLEKAIRAVSFPFLFLEKEKKAERKKIAEKLLELWCLICLQQNFIRFCKPGSTIVQIFKIVFVSIYLFSFVIAL